MELRGQEEHTATATAFLLPGRLLWCSSLSHRLNCAAAKFVAKNLNHYGYRCQVNIYE
jgi:hypothetical protein